MSAKAPTPPVWLLTEAVIRHWTGSNDQGDGSLRPFFHQAGGVDARKWESPKMSPAQRVCPTPLYPRSLFGHEAEPPAGDRCHVGTGGRHLHSIAPERVAAVELAIATGCDLSETAEASKLTPGVCWSVAVRLARPNALAGRRGDARLHKALAATLGRLHRLASKSTPELSARVLVITVALEDAIIATGGAT